MQSLLPFPQAQSISSHPFCSILVLASAPHNLGHKQPVLSIWCTACLVIRLCRKPPQTIPTPPDTHQCAQAALSACSSSRQVPMLGEKQGGTQTLKAAQGTHRESKDLHVLGGGVPSFFFFTSESSASHPCCHRKAEAAPWMPSRRCFRRWRRSGKAPMALCTRLATSARGSWWPSRRSA